MLVVTTALCRMRLAQITGESIYACLVKREILLYESGHAFFFFSNVVLSRQDDYSYDPTKIPVLVLCASFIENTQTRKTQLLLILKTDGQPVT